VAGNSLFLPYTTAPVVGERFYHEAHSYLSGSANPGALRFLKDRRRLFSPREFSSRGFFFCRFDACRFPFIPAC
jgi:hypothetical protein